MPTLMFYVAVMALAMVAANWIGASTEVGSTLAGWTGEVVALLSGAGAAVIAAVREMTKEK